MKYPNVKDFKGKTHLHSHKATWFFFLIYIFQLTISRMSSFSRNSCRFVFVIFSTYSLRNFLPSFLCHANILILISTCVFFPAAFGIFEDSNAIKIESADFSRRNTRAGCSLKIVNFSFLLFTVPLIFILSRPSVLSCRWNAKGSGNGQRRERRREKSFFEQRGLRRIGRRSFIWGNRTRLWWRATKLEEI